MAYLAEFDDEWWHLPVTLIGLLVGVVLLVEGWERLDRDYEWYQETRRAGRWPRIISLIIGALFAWTAIRSCEG